MQLPAFRYRHVTPPGEIPDSEQVLCGVCGAQIHVRRNRLGPGSPQAAVHSQFPRHDLWLCPRADQTWHAIAVAIAREAEATASPKRRECLLDEVREILTPHLETPCESSSSP